MPLHRWKPVEGRAKWDPGKWSCERCGVSVLSEAQPFSQWDPTTRSPVLVVTIGLKMDDRDSLSVSSVSGECDEECVRGILES